MEKDRPRAEPAPPPPRVLIVMPDQWSRALLRAELLERGLDTVGAPDMVAALLCRPIETGRGWVEVILIDQDALDERGARLVDLLLSRHKRARALLLASVLLERPSGPWHRILYRPASLDRLAREIADTLSHSAA